jgi:hypothetical protein
MSRQPSFDEHLFARFDSIGDSFIDTDRGCRRFLAKIALNARRSLPRIIPSSRSSLLAPAPSHNLIVSIASAAWCLFSATAR